MPARSQLSDSQSCHCRLTDSSLNNIIFLLLSSRSVHLVGFVVLPIYSILSVVFVWHHYHGDCFLPYLQSILFPSTHRYRPGTWTPDPKHPIARPSKTRSSLRLNCVCHNPFFSPRGCLIDSFSLFPPIFFRPAHLGSVSTWREYSPCWTSPLSWLGLMTVRCAGHLALIPSRVCSSLEPTRWDRVPSQQRANGAL